MVDSQKSGREEVQLRNGRSPRAATGRTGRHQVIAVDKFIPGFTTPPCERATCGGAILFLSGCCAAARPDAEKTKGSMLQSLQITYVWFHFHIYVNRLRVSPR